MSEPEFKWFKVTAMRPDGSKVNFEVVTTYTDRRFATEGVTSNVYYTKDSGPVDDYELSTAMTDLIKATRTAAMRKFPG